MTYFIGRFTVLFWLSLLIVHGKPSAHVPVLSKIIYRYLVFWLEAESASAGTSESIKECRVYKANKSFAIIINLVETENHGIQGQYLFLFTQVQKV